MSVSLIAKEARALGPEAHHFGGDGAIVGRAAVFAARGPGAKGGLAQIAAGRELQERLDARSRQGDRVLARMAALGGDARGAGDEKIRQAIEIGRVQQHQPVFFVRSTFWPNCAASVASRSAIAASRALASGAAARAGAGEIEMIALEHARLLGRKPELVLLRPSSASMRLKQRLVQIGFAAMAREHRRDFALDRLRARHWSRRRSRLKKTLATLSRLRPLRSSASIVLAKLGGAGFAAMASISRARLRARPRRRAGNGEARCGRTAAPRTARSRVRAAGSGSYRSNLVMGASGAHASSA